MASRHWKSRVGLLEAIVFHKALGTYKDKVDRMVSLAASVNELTGAGVDAEVLERIVRWAKTDLTTDLVGEFPGLQGVVGGLYARREGRLRRNFERDLRSISSSWTRRSVSRIGFRNRPGIDRQIGYCVRLFFSRADSDRLGGPSWLATPHAGRHQDTAGPSPGIFTPRSNRSRWPNDRRCSGFPRGVLRG